MASSDALLSPSRALYIVEPRSLQIQQTQILSRNLTSHMSLTIFTTFDAANYDLVTLLHAPNTSTAPIPQLQAQLGPRGLAPTTNIARPRATALSTRPGIAFARPPAFASLDSYIPNFLFPLTRAFLSLETTCHTLCLDPAWAANPRSYRGTEDLAHEPQSKRGSKTCSLPYTHIHKAMATRLYRRTNA